MTYNLDDPIEKRLSNFQPIRERYLRKAFDLLPMFIVFGVTFSSFARWYSQHVILWTYISGGIAFIFSILIMRELFIGFPINLLVIWRRKLLHPISDPVKNPDDPTLEELFLSFLDESENKLNNKVSYVFGFLLMITVGWLIWLLGKVSVSALPTTFKSDPLAAYILIILLAIYCCGAFIGGVIGWRVIAIAIQIRQIGKGFKFDLQLEHPDGCGGLRPFGDLCSTLAYISTPPLLLVAGWLIIVNFGDGANLLLIPQDRVQAMATTLLILTTPFSLLVMISFFLPLTTIHAAMENSKMRLQEDLDQVSQKINQLSIQLRLDAETLSAEQGEALEKKIDFLHRIYIRNNKIPTWPIRADHIWRLASTQIVPIIGVGTSGMGFIKGIIEIFR